MIKYKYYPNEELMIVQYLESITKEELILFVRYCIKIQDKYPIKEIIADYRSVNELYSIDDLVQIANERKKLTTGSNKITIIFLVNNPNDTTMAYLYSSYLKNYSRTKIFSSLEPICNALSYRIAITNLEEMLETNQLYTFDSSLEGIE